MRFPYEVMQFGDMLPSGAMVFSPDGAAIYANCAARTLLGAVAEVAAPLDYFLTEDGVSLEAAQHPVAISIRERRASGWAVLGVQRSVGHAPVWLRVQAAPVFAQDASLEYVIVSLEDASEERRLKRELESCEQRLQTMGSPALNTGVCSRHEAHVLLARAVVDARDKEIPLAVCLLDLDMFKRINQAFGKPCGDEVLLFVAESLGAHLGPDDAFSRIGGGEFLILLPGLTQREAWLHMDRFRESLGETSIPCTGRPASVSGGLVLLRDGEDAPALLERADSLLYLAKLDGRNRIVADASV